jgi:hypothetical protein
MIDEIEKQMLLDIAKELPKYPPLKLGGDVTVKELYPQLSDEEIEFVMNNYTGEMKK